MKRNLYIVAGIAVLLLAAFFAATKFYVRSEKGAQETVTAPKSGSTPKSGSAPGVLVQPDSPSLGSMMARG